MTTKYKLLKPYPNLNVGHIIDTCINGYYTTIDKYGEEITFSETMVGENPDWFAPCLFTTEDGVGIFARDNFYILVTKDYKNGVRKKGEILVGKNISFLEQKPINFDSLTEEGYWKAFSTYEKTQEYLDNLNRNEFKVGDIVVYPKENSIMKIVEFASDNEPVVLYSTNTKDQHSNTFLKMCRKATNEEIIQYYKEQGWVEGAKFKFIPDGSIGEILRLKYKDNQMYVGVNYAFCYEKIEDCELIRESNYPKSWNDIACIEGFCIEDSNSNVVWVKELDSTHHSTWKSVYNTEKQALSALAFAQLSQLVKTINGDWEADWNKNNTKYMVDRQSDKLEIVCYNFMFYPLSFETKEQADFSLEHHKELWEQYYQL